LSTAPRPTDGANWNAVVLLGRLGVVARPGVRHRRHTDGVLGVGALNAGVVGPDGTVDRILGCDVPRWIVGRTVLSG
jgi:hypothetical protein